MTIRQRMRHFLRRASFDNNIRQLLVLQVHKQLSWDLNLQPMDLLIDQYPSPDFSRDICSSQLENLPFFGEHDFGSTTEVATKAVFSNRGLVAKIMPSTFSSSLLDFPLLLLVL